MNLQINLFNFSLLQLFLRPFRFTHTGCPSICSACPCGEGGAGRGFSVIIAVGSYNSKLYNGTNFIEKSLISSADSLAQDAYIAAQLSALIGCPSRSAPPGPRGEGAGRCFSIIPAGFGFEGRWMLRWVFAGGEVRLKISKAYENQRFKLCF